MESLLTLSIGQFHAVDLAIRIIAVLVAAAALLLAMSAACIPVARRLPLIISAVALAAAAWFEAGVSGAWRGAFELAGSSYCVTGLPLAGEDRVIAWALGVPALLFCFGFAQIDHRSREFRHLCVATLLMALLGPIFLTVAVAGLFYSLTLLRNLWLKPSNAVPSIVTYANRIGLGGLAVALLLTFLGAVHLLPLGSTAEALLVRGEVIRSLSDLLALVLPAIALVTVIYNLSEKETGSDVAT